MAKIIIDNIAEAQEAVAAIGDFLERFHQTLGKLGSLTGKSKREATSPSYREQLEPASELATNRQTQFVITPETMPDRVIAILKSASGPLTPKQMAEHYASLGWPAPKNGKLYTALLSSAYY